VSEYFKSEEPHDPAKTSKYRASPPTFEQIGAGGSCKLSTSSHRPTRRAYHELKWHRAVSQPAQVLHATSISPQVQVPIGTLALEALCDQDRSKIPHANRANINTAQPYVSLGDDLD
jgi:hypothetical protein